MRKREIGILEVHVTFSLPDWFTNDDGYEEFQEDLVMQPGVKETCMLPCGWVTCEIQGPDLYRGIREWEQVLSGYLHDARDQVEGVRAELRNQADSMGNRSLDHFEQREG